MPVEILAVDDEPDLTLLIRQKFRKRIREEDWVFHFASNGEEALGVIDAHPEISLVLTDINMPVMDGLTLLDRLAQRNLTLKSIVVSAYGDMRNIRVAMNRGAFDFITKPIDFEDLEITVDKTLREVHTNRTAMAAKIELLSLQKELAVARRIHQAFIPEASLTDGPVRLHAHLEPAREVGGDFYDFFRLDDGRLGIVIGDVSGKGVSAALFMAITRTLLKAIAMQGRPPDRCLTEVNGLLYPQSLSEMFVTATYAIIDPETGELAYATAGHFAPIRVTPGGAIESLDRIPGLALCMRPDFTYQTVTTRLDRGDGLFLFTDGVTEAVNSAGTQFSDERLHQTLAATAGFTPEQRIHAVCLGIDAFIDGAEQSDDITMLALNFDG